MVRIDVDQSIIDMSDVSTSCESIALTTNGPLPVAIAFVRNWTYCGFTCTCRRAPTLLTLPGAPKQRQARLCSCGCSYFGCSSPRLLRLRLYAVANRYACCGCGCARWRFAMVVARPYHGSTVAEPLSTPKARTRPLAVARSGAFPVKEA